MGGLKEKKIPYGYCYCGCGQKTKFYKYTDKRTGTIKGEPRKYIIGHHMKGKNNHNWKNGKVVQNGYVYLLFPNHPKSHNGYVKRSHIVMEKIINGPLPDDSIVHHIDENKKNDSPDNLMLCLNIAEHNKIHQQQRAIAACGNRNWRQCRYCGQYDDPKNLYIPPDKDCNAFHRECRNTFLTI